MAILASTSGETHANDRRLSRAQPLHNWATMLSRFAFLGIVLSLGIFALATTARVNRTQAGKVSAVPVEQVRPVERTVLVFIDSLSREVATNAEIMPTLGHLAREGVSFDVEPCRDQLTYLCLRAAFTGHDDSSLLAVSDNFRPNREGPPDSLLSAVSDQGKRIAVIGASDFHPYRRWLASERELSKQAESVENVSAQLRDALQSNPQIIVVALASGDMIAHAHGTQSKQYAAAFRRIDATVAAVAAIAGVQSNLVVFGDHGHDTSGRHLPGTEAKTWAVYVGPAFRQGVKSSIDITDHRAVLGTLLGVPTEPVYRGLALSSVFDAGWVARTFSRGLPNLQAPRDEEHGSSSSRLWVAVLVAGFALLGAKILAWDRFGAWPLGLTAFAVTIAAASGFGYDWIRNLVHDHGDSPERAVCLSLPIALGASLAAVARVSRLRALGLGNPLHSTAAGALLVAFLLMLPTAYYYGSRRAVVLAGVLGLLSVAGALFERDSTWRSRMQAVVALLFAGCVLVNFYAVRQLGPETGGSSSWALDAPLYTQSTWLALVAAKLVLYVVSMAPRAAEHPSDCAAAAGLLSASVLVEFAGARLPRELYSILFLAVVVGSLFARRQFAASLFAGSLLLLDHLYGRRCPQLAPMELLLAATAVLLAWQRSRSPRLQPTWLAGLTITIAVYLMLWPTVGFHLAGLDFSFMFEWVPEADYDQAWRWIAFGVVVKLGLPIALVIVVARDQLRDALTRGIVMGALGAKVALLCVLIAFYGISHSMASQQATAMLSELVLVLFGTCTALMAMPSSKALRTSFALSQSTAAPAVSTAHRNAWASPCRARVPPT